MIITSVRTQRNVNHTLSVSAASREVWQELELQETSAGKLSGEFWFAEEKPGAVWGSETRHPPQLRHKMEATGVTGHTCISWVAGFSRQQCVISDGGALFDEGPVDTV